MKHPKTPKEYDKEMKRFEGEMAKIDTSKVSEFGSMNWDYAPPKLTNWGIDYGYAIPMKSRLKSFIGGIVIGLLIGSLVTVALYGTMVLNLLEETSNDSKLDHTFILNEIIR